MTMNSYNLTELARKLSNLILIGMVQEADYANARLRVKSGELITAWLPWLTARAGADKAWWAPEIGEQVLVLCPDGNPAQGWVLPAGFTEHYAQPESSSEVASLHFNDGATLRYDRTAHQLAITLPEGATINLISTGGVKITGDVSITGNLIASGDITDKTRSMAEDRAIYNSHDHAGMVPIPTQTQ